MKINCHINPLGLRLIFLVVLAGAVSQNANGQVDPPSMKTPHYLVHQSVEEKAYLLNDNNQDTYRVLADEIFEAAHGFGALAVTQGIGPTKIPITIDNVIKDRLVYAEMQYRRGLAHGVKEQSIVEFTNMLAAKLKLPSYAQTSPAQVRHIRIWLMRVNPKFMGDGAFRTGMEPGQEIYPELSPLQATHLLLEVLGHKLSDPFFQLTPDEWDRDKQRREAERNEQLAKGVISGSNVVQATAIMQNPKESEMRLAVAQSTNSLTPVEAFSLIDDGFKILGITR